MSRMLLVRVLMLAISLSAGTLGVASLRTHTVRGGESVSSIAKRYYGNYELTKLLLQYNGKPDSVIQPGEKLKIPFCEVHRVRGGDTLSKLAQRYLDRPLAYREIAALNGLRPDKPLQVGQRIVIPVVLPHRLKRGESLATLAKRYYGGTDLLHVLQSYNGIDDPRRLSVGQKIEVPLVAFLEEGKTPETPAKRRSSKSATSKPATPKPATPKPATPEPASVKQEQPTVEPAPKPATPETPRYQSKIALARKAYSLGEYERARELLEALQPDVLRDGSAVERAELLRLIAFVYVAFDLPVQACAAHRSLSRLSSKTRLDPDFVSPKIRQVLSECMERGS